MIFKRDKEEALPWSKEAEQVLEQSAAQIPGGKMVANQLTKRLRRGAESVAREAGHSEVKAEDLMEALLAMLPANMREMVEKRMQEGPEGIKKLKDDLL